MGGQLSSSSSLSLHSLGSQAQSQHGHSPPNSASECSLAAFSSSMSTSSSSCSTSVVVTAAAAATANADGYYWHNTNQNNQHHQPLLLHHHHHASGALVRPLLFDADNAAGRQAPPPYLKTTTPPFSVVDRCSPSPPSSNINRHWHNNQHHHQQQQRGVHLITPPMYRRHQPQQQLLSNGLTNNETKKQQHRQSTKTTTTTREGAGGLSQWDSFTRALPSALMRNSDNNNNSKQRSRHLPPAKLLISACSKEALPPSDSNNNNTQNDGGNYYVAPTHLSSTSRTPPFYEERRMMEPARQRWETDAVTTEAVGQNGTIDADGEEEEDGDDDDNAEEEEEEEESESVENERKQKKEAHQKTTRWRRSHGGGGGGEFSLKASLKKSGSRLFNGIMRGGGYLRTLLGDDANANDDEDVEEEVEEADASNDVNGYQNKNIEHQQRRVGRDGTKNKHKDVLNNNNNNGKDGEHWKTDETNAFERDEAERTLHSDGNGGGDTNNNSSMLFWNFLAPQHKQQQRRNNGSSNGTTTTIDNNNNNSSNSNGIRLRRPSLLRHSIKNKQNCHSSAAGVDGGGGNGLATSMLLTMAAVTRRQPVVEFKQQQQIARPFSCPIDGGDSGHPQSLMLDCNGNSNSNNNGIASGIHVNQEKIPSAKDRQSMPPSMIADADNLLSGGQRKRVIQASSSELIRALGQFIGVNCHPALLEQFEPAQLASWLRGVDRALILQGWQDVAFINPANIVFLFMLIRDAFAHGESKRLGTLRELHSFVLLCLYISYSYMGNEISYPLKPFITESTNRASFWSQCVRLIKAHSGQMLRLNASSAFFLEVFTELKTYSPEHCAPHL